MRVELNDRWMKAGVTMVDPSTVYLDHGVELAEDVDPRAERDPPRRDHGRGADPDRHRLPAPSTRSIGADCVVWASIIERSTVEDEVTIGPFSHLRPGAHVGSRSRDRQLRRDQEQPPRRARPPAPHELPRRRGRRRRTRTSGPARSPPTTTASPSTARRSARACSWASTRCSGRRVTLGDGSKTGAGCRRHQGRAPRASSPSACRPASARSASGRARDPRSGDDGPSKPAAEAPDA